MSETACVHCWHETGLVKTIAPPRYEMVCCHCGERKCEAKAIDHYGHGPYDPRKHGLQRGPAVGIAAAKREGKYKGRKPGTTKASVRQAVELREKGLSLQQIGNALGVSKMAVSRYLKRGASRAV